MMDLQPAPDDEFVNEDGSGPPYAQAYHIDDTLEGEIEHSISNPSAHNSL